MVCIDHNAKDTPFVAKQPSIYMKGIWESPTCSNCRSQDIIMKERHSDGPGVGLTRSISDTLVSMVNGMVCIEPNDNDAPGLKPPLHSIYKKDRKCLQEDHHDSQMSLNDEKAIAVLLAAAEQS